MLICAWAASWLMPRVTVRIRIERIILAMRVLAFARVREHVKDQLQKPNPKGPSQKSFLIPQAVLKDTNDELDLVGFQLRIHRQRQELARAAFGHRKSPRTEPEETVSFL